MTFNFDVGADHPLCLPQRVGWTASHDIIKRTVLLSNEAWKLHFTYELYGGNGQSTGCFLKDEMLVQGPRYGRRVNASTALENLCTGRYA